MSTYTPPTEYVRVQYVNALIAESTAVDEARAAFDRWLSATLATVRPNPDDARQVEAVARALHASEYDEPDSVTESEWQSITDAEREFLTSQARAVLTALAEAVA